MLYLLKMFKDTLCIRKGSLIGMGKSIFIFDVFKFK